MGEGQQDVRIGSVEVVDISNVLLPLSLCVSGSLGVCVCISPMRVCLGYWSFPARIEPITNVGVLDRDMTRHS